MRLYSTNCTLKLYLQPRSFSGTPDIRPTQNIHKDLKHFLYKIKLSLPSINLRIHKLISAPGNQTPSTRVVHATDLGSVQFRRSVVSDSL